MAMQEYFIWNDLKSSSKPLPEMRNSSYKSKAMQSLEVSGWVLIFWSNSVNLRGVTFARLL